MTAHPEKEAEYNRTRYSKNRQRYIDASKAWHLNNPEASRRIKRSVQATYRARKLNQFIEDVDSQIVYDMHGGMCGICKDFIEGDFHVDHVIPLSKGGMHGYINVQPAHPKCNLRKHNHYHVH
jgi:5-methylcytosine-specific restriction endonuclease McrA